MLILWRAALFTLMLKLSGASSLHFRKRLINQPLNGFKGYIAQGDVFQVNLSMRQSRSISTSSEELYEWLRLVNPSPYMGFLRCPDFQLVSASPELLVELRDGKLATRPIAGTRRRGRTEEEDRLMAEELLGQREGAGRAYYAGRS